MRTLHRPADRAEILSRAQRLSSVTPARWGRLTAPQMVTHITDAIRMATGSLPVPSKRMVVRFPPLKQLLVYLLPMPKGLPTAPALLARAPAEWGSELTQLAAELDAFGRHPAGGPWPVHPAFGTLSRRAWGVLAYRHVNHHLRQFGV